jgi:hypothetical protein
MTCALLRSAIRLAGTFLLRRVQLSKRGGIFRLESGVPFGEAGGSFLQPGQRFFRLIGLAQRLAQRFLGIAPRRARFTKLCFDCGHSFALCD